MDIEPALVNDARQTRIPVGDPSLLPPTLPPARAGRLLGIGRRQTYEAVHRGDIPAIRIGRRLLVPTSWILEQLGLPAEQLISLVDEPQRSGLSTSPMRSTSPKRDQTRMLPD